MGFAKCTAICKFMDLYPILQYSCLNLSLTYFGQCICKQNLEIQASCFCFLVLSLQIDFIKLENEERFVYILFDNSLLWL